MTSLLVGQLILACNSSTDQYVLQVVLVVMMAGLVLLLGILVLLITTTMFSCKTAALLDQLKQINKNINTPPGSCRLGYYWPLVGETLEYLKPHKSNSIGQFLKERCSKYGRVFKSHLFGHPTIVSCDLDLNTFILQNEGKLFESSYPKPVQNILGKHSMLLVSGEQHRKLRSIAVSHIGTSKSRPDFLHYVQHLSTSLMESWKHSKRVHFSKEAKQFTLHVMLKNLIDVEREDAVAPRLLQDFMTFMKGFVSLPLYIPGSPYAKAIKARRRISSTLRDIIKERKKENEGAGGGGRRRRYYSSSSRGYSAGDFLDEILERGDLNEEEEVGIVMDLLLAGYETTSGLMAFVVYFLALHPNALHHFRHEHRQLIIMRQIKEPDDGDGLQQLLDFDDYKQMGFTMNVISEALRCGNLVKFVHRKALKDVKFRDYVIPGGWQVLPVISAPHLDPSLHQHPSLFNPWRWQDEAISKKVTPFGGGIRLCPGAELAKLETAFFLHHFVLNYSWKIKEDECPISYPYLEFKRGLLLEIEPLAEEA